MTENKPTTFWGSFKASLSWVAVKLLAPGAVLILVLIAIVLVAMGFKELQIGGLIAKLLGKKSEESKVAIANSIPANRVDATGKLIPVGTPDSKGDTQAVVVPIQAPGLFSNPSTVTVVPPGKTEPVEITLPDGVKSKDVESVVVVQPDNFVVTVKTTFGVSAEEIDDLIKKYGE